MLLSLILTGCSKSEGLVGERVYEEVQVENYKDSKERYQGLLQEIKNIKIKETMSKRADEVAAKKAKEERLRLEAELVNRFGYAPEYVQEVEFILSFYTSLPCENDNYTITAWGEPLEYGMVASNYYDKDTKILLDGWGNFRVADRGGSNFDVYNRLDVLIPRNSGESDSEYLNRVNNMGIVKVKGYIHR